MMVIEKIHYIKNVRFREACYEACCLWHCMGYINSNLPWILFYLRLKKVFVLKNSFK